MAIRPDTIHRGDFLEFGGIFLVWAHMMMVGSKVFQRPKKHCVSIWSQLKLNTFP